MSSSFAQYRAVNAPDVSGNVIHSDEGAATYGFDGGGLVPGTGIFAYICESLRTEIGTLWLEKAYTTVRYTKPLYDGELLDISLSYDELGDSTIDGSIVARNPQGVTIADGAFTIGDRDRYSGSRPRLGRTPRRAELTPMTGATLVATETLTSVETIADTGAMKKFLIEFGIDPKFYVETGVASVAYLMDMYDLLYMANFRRVGPGIHAGTEIHVLRPVVLGEALSIRGRVDRLFRRNGNGFIRLEIGFYDVTEAPALWCIHTGLYDLQRPAPLA